MVLKKQGRGFLWFFLLFFIESLAIAGPVWTFQPDSSYPPHVAVPEDEIVLVKYAVTNQSKKVHLMLMKPITGVSQVTEGVGVCPQRFSLDYHQSCTLILSFDGHIIPSTISGGPTICHEGSIFECYQPGPENRLNVTKVGSRVANISADPETITLIAQTELPVALTLTNHSSVPAKDIQLTMPEHWSDLTYNAEACKQISASGTCQITFTPGNTTYTTESIVIHGSNTNQVTVHLSVVPLTYTALSLSKKHLALSVDKPSLNPALTGHARQLKITNTGTATAYHVAYAANADGHPSIQSISPEHCGNIAAGESCLLTIKPGAEATTTPITLTITSANAPPLSAALEVLTYGSIYQSGYVFAIEDDYENHPQTASIGGKVAALTDQAHVYPAGIIWSSNGAGMASTDVDYHSIYGIDVSSTLANPSPLTPPILTPCYGKIDGACNTDNIVRYYSEHYPTKVSSTYYAAGLCKATIGGYTDWYLPAICEQGPDSGYNICPLFPVQQNMVENLAFLSAPSCTGPSCLQGFYWSSTEDSMNIEENAAWGQFFATNRGSLQNSYDRNYQQGVRCVRRLTDDPS